MAPALEFRGEPRSHDAQRLGLADRALAQRHVGYGVSERDYATVGAALLWTLQQGLGAGFTPEVRSAWAAAYDLISTNMIAAARSLPDPLPGAAAHVAVTRSAAQL